MINSYEELEESLITAEYGEVLHIAPGEIEVYETLVVPSGVTLRGESCLLIQTAPDLEVLLLNGRDIGVYGINIAGDGEIGDIPGNGAIRIGSRDSEEGADGCDIQDVCISSVGRCGIVVSSRSDRTRIQNCIIESVGEEGVYVLGDFSRIEGCDFLDCAESGVKSRGAHNVVTSCRIENSGQFGVLVTEEAYGGMTSNNYISGCRFDGIRVNNIKDHFVTQNVIYDSGPGRAQIRASGEGTLVINNVGKGNTPKYGLDVVSKEVLYAHNYMNGLGMNFR